MNRNMDEQHAWLKEYQVDRILLGSLCETNPALRKSWDQFKMMYDLCRAGELHEQA